MKVPYDFKTLYNANQAISMLYDALQVLVRTPHIQAYLKQHDPKALEQAESAINNIATEEVK